MAVTTTLLIGGAVALSLGKPKTARMETESYDLWGSKVDLAIPRSNFPTDEELKEIDAPMMPGCQHGWYETTHAEEGETTKTVKLHYRKFTPKGTPKGIVVYHHGIQAHSGNAFRLANGRALSLSLLQDYCAKKDYALYALDMYGHGFSEGIRMYVPSWQQSRDDLVGFCDMVVEENKTQDRSMPFFLMGHSFGSCLGLHALHWWQDHPDRLPSSFGGLIVLAPAVIADVPPAPVVFVLRRLLAPRYPRWIPFFMPNPVSPDRIWRDPEVFRLSTLPSKEKWGLDCSGQPFCLQTGVQCLEATEVVKDVAVPALRLPVCAIHGTKDYAVLVESTQYIEKYHANPADLSVHYIEGGYHDLLADPVADQVIDTIDEFIRIRIEKLGQS